MKLALAPIPYLWPRERILAFYEDAAQWPADIVYLGETVCSKRRVLRGPDWLAIAERLAAAGKEVVLSSLTLVEAESELLSLRRMAGNGLFTVEANDGSALALVSGKGGFVIGAHINVYNPRTLAVLAGLGARRWVVPGELPAATLARVLAERPAGLEVEVQVAGRVPLAFSARCFTARAHDTGKDDCNIVCDRYPDGLPVRTQEGEHFLTLNGIQVQSAGAANLAGALPEMREMGIDVARLVPLEEGTAEAAKILRDAIDGRTTPADAEAALNAILPAPVCNGYWRGEAGMDWRETEIDAALVRRAQGV